MAQLTRATAEDVVQAVNQDGTVVDVYRAFAAMQFNTTYEEVTDAQRTNWKEGQYMRAYGGRHAAN